MPPSVIYVLCEVYCISALPSGINFSRCWWRRIFGGGNLFFKVYAQFRVTGNFLPLFFIGYRATFSTHIHCTVITCMFGTIDMQWTMSGLQIHQILVLEEPGKSGHIVSRPLKYTKINHLVYGDHLGTVQSSDFISSTLRQFTPYWLTDQKTIFAFSCDLTTVESGDWPHFLVLDVSIMSFHCRITRGRVCDAFQHLM